MPSKTYAATDRLLDDLELNTVCRGARCPNIFECYARRTATFLVMGNVCTRGCRFCAILGGRPGPLDEGEPLRVAEASKRLGLRHVVITSVTRDDLPNGGAEHFARTIRAVKNVLDCTVEVLTPDFKGDSHALETVLNAGPDVFNHNVETVPRIYSEVRPGADYERSLELLRRAAQERPDIFTKSGIMLGLGETDEEIKRTLLDIRETGCRIVTIGQYLCPGEDHFPTARYYTPDEFDNWKGVSEDMGFDQAHSGPFVRSSYMADTVLKKSKK